MPDNNTEQVQCVQPTLMLGLGGTGYQIVTRIRERLADYVGGIRYLPFVQFRLIDTDSTNNDTLRELGWSPENEFMCAELPDKNDFLQWSAQATRGSFAHINEWLSEGMGVCGSGAVGAGQIRQLSRAAFFKDYTKIKSKLSKALNDMVNNYNANAANKSPKLSMLGTSYALQAHPEKQVLIFASIAGGTGCGMLLDTVGLLKDLDSNLKIQLYLLSPDTFVAGTPSSNQERRLMANGYTMLRELEFLSSADQKLRVDWTLNTPKKIPGGGWEEIFMFTCRNSEGHGLSSRDDLYDMIADSVYRDFLLDAFAGAKRSASPNLRTAGSIENKLNEVKLNRAGVEVNIESSYGGHYTSTGLYSLSVPKDVIQEACSYKLCVDALEYWKSGRWSVLNDVKKLRDCARSILEKWGVELHQVTSGALNDGSALIRIGRKPSNPQEYEVLFKAIATVQDNGREVGVLDYIENHHGLTSQPKNNCTYFETIKAKVQDMLHRLGADGTKDTLIASWHDQMIKNSKDAVTKLNIGNLANEIAQKLGCSDTSKSKKAKVAEVCRLLIDELDKKISYNSGLHLSHEAEQKYNAVIEELEALQDDGVLAKIPLFGGLKNQDSKRAALIDEAIRYSVTHYEEAGQKINGIVGRTACEMALKCWTEALMALREHLEKIINSCGDNSEILDTDRNVLFPKLNSFFMKEYNAKKEKVGPRGAYVDSLCVPEDVDRVYEQIVPATQRDEICAEVLNRCSELFCLPDMRRRETPSLEDDWVVEFLKISRERFAGSSWPAEYSFWNKFCAKYSNQTSIATFVRNLFDSHAAFWLTKPVSGTATQQLSCLRLAGIPKDDGNHSQERSQLESVALEWTNQGDVDGSKTEETDDALVFVSYPQPLAVQSIAGLEEMRTSYRELKNQEGKNSPEIDFTKHNSVFSDIELNENKDSTNLADFYEPRLDTVKDGFLALFFGIITVENGKYLYDHKAGLNTRRYQLASTDEDWVRVDSCRERQPWARCNLYRELQHLQTVFQHSNKEAREYIRQKVQERLDGIPECTPGVLADMFVKLTLMQVDLEGDVRPELRAYGLNGQMEVGVVKFLHAKVKAELKRQKEEIHNRVSELLTQSGQHPSDSAWALRPCDQMRIVNWEASL